MPLVQSIEVSRFLLVVKFQNSIRPSSFDNDNIRLLTNDATPTPLVGFKEITPSDDYNSIRRELTLYFQDPPDVVADYQLEFKDVVLSSGTVVGLDTSLFHYPFDSSILEAPIKKSAAPQVEDHSVRADAFVTSDSNYVSNVDFYVLGSDPEDGEIFLESDHKNGRLTIRFSEEPSLAYVTSTYFKVQKKLISTEYSRWETITDTLVKKDSNRSRVYISLPAVDADPVVHEEDGFDYFVDGYKYRIKLHADIAAES